MNHIVEVVSYNPERPLMTGPSHLSSKKIEMELINARYN